MDEKKKLEDMTLEELWQLFPIILSDHSEKWTAIYKEEEKLLQKKLTTFNAIINHVGSTSIPKIKAKPTIDILVEIPFGSDVNNIKNQIISCGYVVMSETEKRISFNKGYTEDGFAEKVYHLHLRFFGDNDELYFRDYLRENAFIAEEYEKIKIPLSKKYEHDRDAYTEAKTDFILKQTEKAKQLYPDKYKR